MQWHRRMGHASKQTLITLAEASLIPITTNELSTLGTHSSAKHVLLGNFIPHLSQRSVVVLSTHPALASTWISKAHSLLALVVGNICWCWSIKPAVMSGHSLSRQRVRLHQLLWLGGSGGATKQPVCTSLDVGQWIRIHQSFSAEPVCNKGNSTSNDHSLHSATEWERGALHSDTGNPLHCSPTCQRAGGLKLLQRQHSFLTAILHPTLGLSLDIRPITDTSRS
jgi:hypothetical protein